MAKHSYGKKGGNNLRNLSVSPGDGVVADDTMLASVSAPTPAERAKNATVEYTTPKTPLGNLGGEHSRS